MRAVQTGQACSSSSPIRRPSCLCAGGPARPWCPKPQGQVPYQPLEGPAEVISHIILSQGHVVRLLHVEVCATADGALIITAAHFRDDCSSRLRAAQTRALLAPQRKREQSGSEQQAQWVASFTNQHQSGLHTRQAGPGNS